MNATASTPLFSIPSVVYQHAEDAAFYWSFRDGGARAFAVDLDELAHGDALLEANLEGLRTNGADGWALALAQLKRWHMPGEAFVCAVLAMEQGDEKRFDALWAEIEDAPEALDGLWSACGWLSWPVVAPWAQAWARAEDARQRWLAVGAYSQHRQPLGECADTLAVDTYPRVRAEALLHAGLIGDVSAQPKLVAALHDTAAPLECRVAAACAGALLGDMQGVYVLADAITLDRTSPLALSIQALCLPDAELDTLISDPRSSELVRLALIRESGAVRWLPEVINIARQTHYAEAAGAVFIYLTGADQNELELAEVEDNDPEDSDRGNGWIPDPDKLAAWWSAHRAGFVFKRAIGGVSSTPDLWSELLTSGGQQARQHAAWALGLSRPGNGVVNVFAPAHRQREWLSAAVG